MTGQEIIKRLKDSGIYPSVLAYQEWTEADIEIPNDIEGWEAIEKYVLNKLNLGEIKEVNSKGDREGGGDYSMKVFHFVDHNAYVKITGFYSSYSGTDWDEGYQVVTPKEKVVTVFE
ncbi:MAG: hypothetical protein CMH22_05825 [Methylophaga sp.]|nr:hypothetical protein [Methylophaga sp.]|tara:strand:+ start:84373 stop:84723 length:351 start_codon:yes stop_codon:yes gene_type:complete